MNFTLEKKFNLAVVCLGIQLLMLISGYLFPLFPYMGEISLIIYRFLSVFSMVGMLPFFITILQNKSLILHPKNCEKTAEKPLSNTNLIKHIATRIGSIILIFGFSYVFILNGMVDPAGYGIIYAGIATAVIVLIGLIIDAIIIYTKEKDSSRFYTNIFIISAFILGIFSIL